MKFTVNVDCTPEEAREFVGLPNIAPLQDKMMKELEQRMQEQVKNMDPETFVKTWMPATVQGWGDMQKMFWSQMGGMQAPNATTGATAPKDKDSK